MNLPVAKSYQSLKKLSKPFKRNGRMYITIETKSGNRKDVRWYTDIEYAKMYPEEGIKNKVSDPYYKSQKYTLGFDKGYIIIFRNVKDEHEDWFEQSICRYTRWWGWYVPSTMQVPEDFPSGVEPVKLYWDSIGNEEEQLQKEQVIKNCVYAALYPKKNTSLPQGDIGDRIEKTLTVEQNILTENKRFNSKTYTHYMRDNEDNLYMWKTAARNWGEGEIKVVRGTVKEFDNYKGEVVTVLTRCIEK